MTENGSKKLLYSSDTALISLKKFLLKNPDFLLKI